MKNILNCLFLLLTTSAFAQTHGVIDCDNTLGIPAWDKPGSPVEIKQLPCGQSVTIIGLENGFAKIRISENLYGYVDAKNVRSLDMAGEPDRRIAGLEAPIKEPQQQRSTASIPNPGTVPQPTERVSSIANETPRQSHDNEDPKPGRHRFGLGFEVSNIYYDEPIMRNKGFMYGVSGDYAYRPNKFMLKVDARFSLGNLDYRGTGTMSGKRNYNFETRFAFGKELTSSRKTSVIPFAGLGYRYLFDGSAGMISSTGKFGYDRKSNYLYSPIGMETMFRLKGGWSLGFSGEYDLFWHGWQYSKLGNYQISTAPPIILTDYTAINDQNGGYGTRGSIVLIKDLGRVNLSFEPYFRYWNIEKSHEFSVYQYPYTESNHWLIYEPANTTTEWGLKLGIRF